MTVGRARDHLYSFTHAAQHVPDVITVAQSLEALGDWSRIRNASAETVFEPFEFTQHLASRPGRRMHAFLTDGLDLAGYAGMNSAHESDLVASIGIWGGGDWSAPETSMRVQVLAEFLEEWCQIAGAVGAELSAKTDLPGRVEFWANRSWAKVGEHHTLRAEPIPCAQDAGPPDLQIVSLNERPDLKLAIYEIYKTTWINTEWGVDHDLDVLPFDRWWENIERWPGSSGDTFFVAMLGGIPVGYSELDLGGNVDDRSTAYCAYTGVLPEWQGAGVATALKQYTMNWAAKHGLQALYTGNDEDNAAIIRLNQRFGFRKSSTSFEMYRKFVVSDLAGSSI